MLVTQVYLVCENSMSCICDTSTFGGVLYGAFIWGVGFLRLLRAAVTETSECYSEGGAGLISSADRCIISHPQSFGFGPSWMQDCCSNSRLLMQRPLIYGRRQSLSSYLSVFTIEGNLSQILLPSSKACSLM